MITHLLVFVLLGITAMPPGSNDPGYTEAVFDANTIQDLLKKNNCDGIRFYNTLNDNSVELMAIPISRGVDMNGGLFNWRPYVVSTGMSATGILTDHISKSKARDYCEAMHNSRYAYYSADFPKSEVEKILSQNKANAIKIIPIPANNELSMQMEGVHFEQGTIQDIPGGSYQIDAIDPCPPLCGNPDDYIYRP